MDRTRACRKPSHPQTSREREATRRLRCAGRRHSTRDRRIHKHRSRDSSSQNTWTPRSNGFVPENDGGLDTSPRPTRSWTTTSSCFTRFYRRRPFSRESPLRTTTLLPASHATGFTASKYPLDTVVATGKSILQKLRLILPTCCSLADLEQSTRWVWA